MNVTEINQRWNLYQKGFLSSILRVPGLKTPGKSKILQNFPRKPNGNVWLSQEMLAKANGIDTGKAHTAVDDTKVVLELGKLFREIAPDVYFSAIASGNKHRVIHHLENEPIVCHAYVERFTRSGH